MGNRKTKTAKNLTIRQTLNMPKYYTGERNYRTSDEALCPAEDWLMRKVLDIEKLQPSYRSSKDRRLLIHAKVLGLHPVPSWWKVKNRLIEATREFIDEEF
jgi:hypothetical protein